VGKEREEDVKPKEDTAGLVSDQSCRTAPKDKRRAEGRVAKKERHMERAKHFYSSCRTGGRGGAKGAYLKEGRSKLVS